MASSALKQQLETDMKSTMKSGDKSRLSVIRLILSAIKQVEVDERIELDDARVTAVLDKMAKQRRESISQFEKANRQDLIDIEQAELEIIQQYLPEALSDEEIHQLISDAMATTGASEIRQMGQVMGILKPQLQGRADMGKVSQLIKSKLGANS
ncbi:MAG: GatB/YqeY domain-containing protein [Gammaproteobacteria bacterium]|nr:GatB/YqeY domain-containing protein [Gammaproteobacteria bacterium]